MDDGQELGRQAFFDGYDGLEIVIAPGLTIKRKCLPFERAAHYLRLEQGFAAATLDANQHELRMALVLEFSKEQNLPAMPLGEFWRVYNCFFSPRVPRPSSNGTTPAATQDAHPAGMSS